MVISTLHSKAGMWVMRFRHCTPKRKPTQLDFHLKRILYVDAVWRLLKVEPFGSKPSMLGEKEGQADIDIGTPKRKPTMLGYPDLPNNHTQLPTAHQITQIAYLQPTQTTAHRCATCQSPRLMPIAHQIAQTGYPNTPNNCAPLHHMAL